MAGKKLSGKLMSARDFLEHLDHTTELLNAAESLLADINRTLLPEATMGEIASAIELPAVQACIRVHVEMLRDPDMFNEEYHGQ
jgi:hypothetical protein